MTVFTDVSQRDSLRRSLTLILTTIVSVSVLAVAFTVVSAFDRAVEPELANRTRLIGSIVRSEVQRALEIGIPIDALTGLDRYLANTLEQFDEVESITITTTTGQPVASVERTAARSLLDRTGLGDVIEFRQPAFTMPIIEGNKLVGSVAIGISPHFVETRLRDVLLDVLVLTLIAILVAVELSLTVTIGSFGKPLDRLHRLLGEQSAGDFLHRVRRGGVGGLGRTAARFNDHAEDIAARVATVPVASRNNVNARIAQGRPLLLRLSDFNDIRIALLLFSVATEIAAAFLPLYARSAARPEWLNTELAAAAPLVMYLVALVVISPFGGSLARRVGARNLFLGSVPPTAVALAAMALSDGVVAISVWRALMAVFYATATIACQEYAIRAGEGTARARPIGAFVAVVYGGVFCGSALGGLLAGRFGFESALLTGAILAVLAGMVGAAAMRGKAGDRCDRSPADLPDGAAKERWLNGRFLGLLLGIAVPMNIATAIVVWFLTPLMLSAAGSGPAEIGRVVMLYYLAIVLFGPAVARASDGGTGPVALVVIGAFGSAAALLSFFLWNGFWAITVAVGALGLGHALIRTPLYTLALRITGGPGPGIDMLRLLERVGAIIGLIASALLLGDVGGEAAIRAVGVIVLAGAVVYTVAELGQRLRRP